ncbi:MAG: sulfatase-like hydrolase/transferase [Planctomycetes bacterium]|nr:sulfatase-like hydrolase/transferase [Planctomycetota bacterium]
MLLRILPMLVLLAGAPVAWARPASAAGEARNVVLILVDDMGWADLGCYGNRLHETPRIDDLARRGARFTDAYANGPNCVPSRASLLTGRYAPRHGMYTVNASARGPANRRALEPIPNVRVLDDAFVTLAEALREAGYVTGCFGKWHLDDDVSGQGFDRSRAAGQIGHPRSYFSPYDNPWLDDGPAGECLTDRLTDEAIGFMDEHRARPFFLYLPFYAVHTPVQGKPDLVEKYRQLDPSLSRRRSAYAAMVETVDRNVGRLVDALAERDLDERTVVILMSDNGGHGRFASMGSLRGAKGELYEGGIRVPLIISTPGVADDGRTVDTPVIGLDLFPTILDLAGAQLPANLRLDGVSLAPLLRRSPLQPRRPPLYWHFPCYLEAGRRSGSPWRTTPVGAIREGRYKLLEFFEDGRLELYDLADDPGETTNLVHVRPEVTRRLHDRIVDWRGRTHAPVPTEPNPKYDGALEATSFASAWGSRTRRVWIGPEYWANRLQDWRVHDGKLECVEGRPRFPLRTAFLLTRTTSPARASFEVCVRTGSAGDAATPDGFSGFLIGAGSDEIDHRLTALVHHRPAADGGLLVVTDAFGRVDVRDNTRGSPGRSQWSIAGPLGADDVPVIEPASTLGDGRAEPRGGIDLRLFVRPDGDGYMLVVSATDADDGALLSRKTVRGLTEDEIDGGLALVSHLGPHFFEGWTVYGRKVRRHDDRAWGPVLATQYTLADGVLELTAQFGPLGEGDAPTAILETRDAGGAWRERGRASIIPESWTAPFRVDGWDGSRDTRFRVVYDLAGAEGGPRRHEYYGTVRREPVDAGALVIASFTGQKTYTGGLRWNHEAIWFPHAEIVDALRVHDPDLLFFSGDQIYEGDLDPAQRKPEDAAILDYLNKWYRWCWAFESITRDRPTITIPDDHDVYHGNLWGAGGRRARAADGLTAQDSGGYVMSPRFVNAVHRTQTSHLPDPPDPLDAEPIGAGYTVYATTMRYAGVSFAILGDRQFKSSPSVTVPEGKVVNGWFRNPDFDPAADADVPGAVLLGERQLAMLEGWADDWSGGTWMKVVLSQTPFVNVATLPADAESGAAIPSIPYLPPDEYPDDHRRAADADSNGWPQSGRDRAVRAFRRAFAIHLAGDQHLASLVQYGVDDWRDAGFAFCAPAIANTWPRRWQPPRPGARREPGAPRYTGDYRDGFGNLMTVYAAANPVRSGRSPARLHDRMPGYGIVRLERDTRWITFEAWPRGVDPSDPAAEQYRGWPRTVAQLDNGGTGRRAFLPELEVRGLDRAVIRVVDETTGRTECSIRLAGMRWRPPVESVGPYAIHVGCPDRDRWQVRGGLRPVEAGQRGEPLVVRFD